MPSLNVELILTGAGASEITSIDSIQSLWSGYGEILRVHLKGGDYPSVVVKHIQLPEAVAHPRGWNTDLSHQRKLKSYQVESAWYQQYATHCDSHCSVPLCLAVEAKTDGDSVIVLTDLASAGFTELKTSIDIDMEGVRACIRWLAHFHATFLGETLAGLGVAPLGLWQCGAYWHLDTRPDELHALTDKRLKQAAPQIDLALRRAKYRTLIHGDAKLANFCFSASGVHREGSQVAAVDFQYPGGGVGVQDLAYFLGSCLQESQLESLGDELLDYYFQVLRLAVNEKHPQVDGTALEAEWRSLYDTAWADFERFLQGWSPSHWKLNSYSDRLTQQVLSRVL
jgi:hypothetical protein